MDVDAGLRLMQLYQALRNARDAKDLDAIKAKIDALVAEASAHFQSQPDSPPTTSPPAKLDA